jgi:fibronectin type 3 domain-containing protein
MAVTVNSVTISGTGFTFSGATFPLTLNSTQTATLTIQFEPTATGAVTGQLSVNSTSSSNPAATVSLSGTGVTSSASVSLTWVAPTSSSDPVAGYNVYRSPSGASSYQLLSSVANGQLAYSDAGVQSGQAYDYIIESVDASGVESVPSNTATVSIP